VFVLPKGPTLGTLLGRLIGVAQQRKVIWDGGPDFSRHSLPNPRLSPLSEQTAAKVNPAVMNASSGSSINIS
jgi:hypothetical protein